MKDHYDFTGATRGRVAPIPFQEFKESVEALVRQLNVMDLDEDSPEWKLRRDLTAALRIHNTHQ